MPNIGSADADISKIHFDQQGSDPTQPADGWLIYIKSTGMFLIDSAGNVTGPLAESGAAPTAHAASHQNNGGDEISVAGLSGQLADEQTPVDHDHSGDAGDGGTFDAANLTSGAATDGYVLTADGAGGAAWEEVPAAAADISTITFIIDGGGSAISTGIKGDLEIPFGCTINQVTLLADQAGDIVIDIWKDSYANYPPTDADIITAAAPPTLSSAAKSQDATLTGWTTSITAGDILRFNVDSATTVTRVTVSLKVTKT